THIAFGDANDTYVQPDRKSQALVNELHRIPVNSVDVLQPTPDSVPILKVEAILPDSINDVVIREFAAVATFNNQTYFHAIGNCARIYVPKPLNNGNVSNPVILEMTFVITSAEPIVEIDPNVVTASRQWVNGKVGEEREEREVVAGSKWVEGEVAKPGISYTFEWQGKKLNFFTDLTNATMQSQPFGDSNFMVFDNSPGDTFVGMLNHPKGKIVVTSGYYEPGDGGSDTYKVYAHDDIVPGYELLASELLLKDCAGVREIGRFIAVRVYNTEIDTRQMGFKACKVELLSERLGHVAEAGAFDNAENFQRFDNLVSLMHDHETTFHGSFAVGFTGYSKVRGDYNTCCRYSAKRGTLIGTTIPVLVALPNADATVIRTPVVFDPDYDDKVEYLRLVNFVVSGAWSQQTWCGPLGGDADGIFDQNGFGYYGIKKLITSDSGAIHCAQDGTPSGGVDEFYSERLYTDWTGKGGCQNFGGKVYVHIDPTNNNPNESPSDDKVIYATSTDGYPALGIGQVYDPDNLFSVIRPKSKCKNGRCFLSTSYEGNVNPAVVIDHPEWSSEAKHNITCNYLKSSKGSVKIIGGRLNKDGTGRLGSFFNVPHVQFLDGVSGIISPESNDGKLVFEGCGKVELKYSSEGEDGMSVLFDGTSEVIVTESDMRQIGFIECEDVKVFNSNIEVPLRTENIVQWAYWNNWGGKHPEKRPNELIASQLVNLESIAPGAYKDIKFLVAGAEIGDFVDAVSASSANSDLFLTSVSRVSSYGYVSVRLYNNSNNHLNLGSQTWSVIVRKRHVIID
ncbi:phage tail-collar fiber domain-containing protein, partial [Vibrio parahaemolyticus]